MKKKRRRDMLEIKLDAFSKRCPVPLQKSLDSYSRHVEDELQKAALLPPPLGTVRKIDSLINEIIVWPTGDFTVYGNDAWRLYESLSTCCFRFHRVQSNHSTHIIRGMRHLLEHAEPCPDVRPMLEHALRVEAALMGAESEWDSSLYKPVALRRSS